MKQSLTGDEGGCWTVTTVGSKYQFDLDAMTVTRIPGRDASPTVNDCTRPILEIIHCTVGARGYWLMEPDADEMKFLEHYWQMSSTIRSIDANTAGFAPTADE
ncbi:hypothetical protein [Cryobacterium glucosi]|uniref:Uncharacterized protein n=1 Tax=Cryobacterium glucosi TaxID=1259175 RepID=A0ABY2II83_9MICO|nr:hypothetical protein [Cryobacterium glucosi]TFC16540.1 hypothetical protein E3O46_17970 [Cryobacterium glucosi]